MPPTAFDATVADLVALGDERHRRLSTQDVGEQIVDIEARLATQRDSVERVRALLAEADPARRWFGLRARSRRAAWTG